MASTKHRRGRKIVIGVLCVAIAGGAAVAIVARKPKSTSAIAVPSIFKTATISRGDLTTTERIDGVVQLSSTLTVLHRIEGQTSSSPTPSASTAASVPAAAAATTTGRNTNTTAAASSALLLDCPTTTPAPTTTTPAPTTTTTPADTTPDTTPAGTTPDTSPVDTTPAATTTTTTTTVAATEPATTVSAAPCDATTTTTVAPPDTTVGAAGGRTRGGGGGGGGNGSGAASGGGGSSAAAARITQTVTSIIAPNTAIHQGDVLYTVDGAPVVALDGALPAWRTMSTSSVDGPDIAQLEASLVALGYDPAQKVTVDNHFDSATRTMVEAWQKGLGLKATGTVTLGSVVFLPSSTTVSSVTRAVGDTVSDGDAVMSLAAPSQVVLIDVPAGDEAQVVPGLSVGIGTVKGTVSRLRSADQNGAVVVEAVVTPAAPIENATNGSDVKVTLTLDNNSGALIAPAEALVSRLDGSYAVQVKTPDGTTKFVTVDLLGVSGGNVAIRGADLTEGTAILLPA
jgi:uncharacterized membrane protein YgcG